MPLRRAFAAGRRQPARPRLCPPTFRVDGLRGPHPHHSTERNYVGSTLRVDSASTIYQAIVLFTSVSTAAAGKARAGAPGAAATTRRRGSGWPGPVSIARVDRAGAPLPRERPIGAAASPGDVAGDGQCGCGPLDAADGPSPASLEPGAAAAAGACLAGLAGGGGGDGGGAVDPSGCASVVRCACHRRRLCALCAGSASGGEEEERECGAHSICVARSWLSFHDTVRHTRGEGGKGRDPRK